MDNIQYYVLAVIAVLIIHYVKTYWKKIVYRKDVVFPDPKQKRSDLFYGYYSCKHDQLAETKDHVNIFMESQFSGQDKLIQNILDAKLTTILDLAPQVFVRNPNGLHTVRENAYDLLDNLFNLMSNKGALWYVKYLYPIDEPNNTVGNINELTKAFDVITKVAAKYTELKDVKYAVIYAAGKPCLGTSLYDVLGIDDYDMKSSVILGREYNALRKQLLPHQRLILVPGGAYQQDPKPFVDYAQNNPEVSMILPFLWFDDDTDSVKSLGIRSNGMKDKHIQAGKSVI